MSVYVDNYRSGRFRGHLTADTSEELHAMARRIGLKREWCQREGTWQEHYDVMDRTRAKAVAAGAIEISARETVMRLRDRREAA